MEHIGAGLAAMGVIGPGIGIGILAGMAAGAIGRNPDAARRLSATLETRRARIEQGLKDADEARVEREQAAAERLATLTAARQEANEVLARAQKQADESREQQIAETRAEIERLREKATADIESERQRAMADVRAQVADLALLAAGRVVGETMNEPRERRLVDEFLAEIKH
jgi:F-type H+-transporting ATPase subunit b